PEFFAGQVSILTPPRGGVRRGAARPHKRRVAEPSNVSILTPPRGGVRQDGADQLDGSISGFNPHSAPRRSATTPEGRISSARSRFNPHSAPRRSATVGSRRGDVHPVVSILTPP